MPTLVKVLSKSVVLGAEEEKSAREGERVEGERERERERGGGEYK